MSRPLNDFSDTWLSVFLSQRDAEATQREARFVAALLTPGSTVLDIACGYGRHAAILSTVGHHVIGLDRDARMLSRARLVCTAVQAEMRHPPFSTNSFDAVLNIWQSFGYFSAAENVTFLSELARIVRPGGLLILDLYNRAFFETVPGDRRFVRAGVAVHETTRLRDNRVNVKLTYQGDPAVDEFEWQVFRPRELESEASAAGWELVGQFADFDTTRDADDGTARIQYVFRKMKA